ncbi:MAG: guanitoxin biosynthesis PLP-dependent transaminase GntE [Anaerolineales bacterium]
MTQTFKQTRAGFARAWEVMPHGVTSNFRYWGDETPVIARGKGARVWDLDGNEFIDYRLGFGPVILGHADERVTRRVAAALADGNVYAHTHPLEVSVAERIVRMCPGVDKVRFANSGAEATQHALRVARGYTGREVIIKFEGDYHGFHDYVMWSTSGADPAAVGPRADPTPAPTGIGIPAAIRNLVITLPYNDFEALARAVQARAGEIAAILVEPIMGNAAGLMPAAGWLQHIRALCDEYGIVMIMDEVKTGFRIAKGGATEYFGVNGDLMTYAKAMGNGFPIAAVGGSNEVMSVVAPGQVGMGGTYCGNLVGTAAADATLDILENTDALAKIAAYGEKLSQGMSDILTEAGIEHVAVGHPAMPGLLLGTRTAPTDWRGVMATDLDAFAAIASGMYARGVEYEDDPREPLFLCEAHGERELNETLERFNDAVGDYKSQT